MFVNHENTKADQKLVFENQSNSSTYLQHNPSWSVFKQNVYKQHICPATGMFGQFLLKTCNHVYNKNFMSKIDGIKIDLIWLGYDKESDWSLNPSSWSVFVFL